MSDSSATRRVRPGTITDTVGPTLGTQQEAP